MEGKTCVPITTNKASTTSDKTMATAAAMATSLLEGGRGGSKSTCKSGNSRWTLGGKLCGRMFIGRSSPESVLRELHFKRRDPRVYRTSSENRAWPLPGLSEVDDPSRGGCPLSRQ